MYKRWSVLSTTNLYIKNSTNYQKNNTNPILKVISIFEYIKINTWLIINYYVIQIQHFDPVHFPLLSPFSG